MNVRILIATAALGLCAAGFAVYHCGSHSCTAPESAAENTLPALPMANQQARLDWETRLLADPATGEIPPNMRARELAFARQLPSMADLGRANDYQWTPRGPFNFGGRTRAAAFDVTDNNILIAGSVSGGIYRSTNQGQSWSRVSPADVNYGISALAQDTRSGKTDTWYCGAGEEYNSASEGQSADYRFANAEV